jgi:hypothetical protein
MMRFLNRPFCTVPEEAYVLRLYAGGWGLSPGGIDNIEPGMESPPTDVTADVPVTATVTINTALLGPQSGPPLEIQWYVNNVPTLSDTSSTSAAYDFTPLSTGLYTIRLEVYDPSPMIHSSLHLDNLTSREWLINAIELQPPTLIAPAADELVILNRPTLSWNAVDYAAAYDIQLSTADLDGSSPPVPFQTSATNSFQPASTLLSGLTYHWRVRSVTSGGFPSEWSDPRSFTSATAQDAIPQRNYAATNTPMLTWGRITWATSYEVQVSANSTFSGTLAFSGSTTENAITVDPLGDGLYYWRVRALNNGVPGQWSAADTFIIDTP